MTSQNFVGAFLGDTPGLSTLISHNDGSENTSGFINGDQPYNYVFVDELKDQVIADGLGNTVLLGQAKAIATDYQVYSSNAASNFESRVWQPMDPSSWGDGVTSLNLAEPLNGRTTDLSAASQMSSCDSSTNPYCVGLVHHNQLRAIGGLQELQWNDDLQADAQAWATTLCTDNFMEHPENGPPENLFDAIPPAGEDELAPSERGIALARAVDSWYLERNYYNYSRNGAQCRTNYLYEAPDGADSYSNFYGMSGSAVYAGAITDLIPAESLMTGHFTQMMQATATQIGCAALKCSELGATGETMLSPQNRWVVSCRYDVGNTRDNYPFSERAAAAFTRDMETSDPSDDAAACYIPCDGPMTPAERAAFVAIDDQVPLADAPTDYVAPGSPECVAPQLPGADFIPANDTYCGSDGSCHTVQSGRW